MGNSGSVFNKKIFSVVMSVNCQMWSQKLHYFNYSKDAYIKALGVLNDRVPNVIAKITLFQL